MSITDVYDIREINRILQEHGIDDEETLARTFGNDNINETPSTASSGGTILSSAHTGQTTNVSDAEEAGSTAPLSINPSMIDSSLTSFLSSLSNSNSSHGSVSSISSQSTPHHSPESFQSVGRFLSTDNDCDGISVLSLMSSAQDMKTNQAASGRKWWEQVEDWDSFAADADMYLKILLMEEMAMKPVHHSSQVQGQSTFFGVWQWFQGLYETITNVSTAASNEEKIVTERAKYVSSLIKQIVAIKKELNEMPPEPPTIPEDLKLDDVPDHIREKLIEHHARVNEWRNVTMQRRKQMETCKEKLLACIIDEEEKIFWKNESDKWDSLNDDGYVEVASKKSSVWEDSTTVCKNKSALPQYATIVAGAIGAGLVVVVSMFFSKRRGC